MQKPGTAATSNPHTAATEKIVADLAYLLKLPVPPVTLWDRGSASGAPQFVAVSAWAYDGVVTWGQIEATATPAQKASLLDAASSMVPFEAWIGAQDRANGGNVLASDDTAGGLRGAWIDYAWSLDYTWAGNRNPDCIIGQMYPMVGAQQRDAMMQVVDGIESLDGSAIEQIVNRIPSNFLPRQIADSILQNLLSRRATLRSKL